MKKYLIITILLSFSLINAVFALTISHPIIELTANPEETLEFTISLTNSETETKTYYAETKNFKAGGEEGRPEYLAGEEGTIGLASWIKLPFNQIMLAPREKQDVKLAIEVPASAEPGGHYAALLWGTAPAGTAESGQVGVSGKTGHLILLKVAGVVKEQGKVLNFKADKNFYSRLPVDFSLAFANEGNVHLKPIGQIEVKNFFGKQTAIIPLNPERKNVLPASQRTLAAGWLKEQYAVAEGRGIFGGLLAEFQNELSQFAFGRYTASVAVIFGAANETVLAETAFWVVPWMLIAVGVLTLVLLIVFVRWYNAFIVRRAIKKINSGI
ncbi:MAG: hypothetical protein AAB851_01115 [Patescibacteria group bacterium]